MAMQQTKAARGAVRLSGFRSALFGGREMAGRDGRLTYNPPHEIRGADELVDGFGIRRRRRCRVRRVARGSAGSPAGPSPWAQLVVRTARSRYTAGAGGDRADEPQRGGKNLL